MHSLCLVHYLQTLHVITLKILSLEFLILVCRIKKITKMSSVNTWLASYYSINIECPVN